MHRAVATLRAGTCDLRSPSLACCSALASHAVTRHVQEQPGFFGREYEQANLRMILERPPAAILVRRLHGLHAARLLLLLGTPGAHFRLHGPEPTAQRKVHAARRPNAERRL